MKRLHLAQKWQGYDVLMFHLNACCRQNCCQDTHSFKSSEEATESFGKYYTCIYLYIIYICYTCIYFFASRVQVTQPKSLATIVRYNSFQFKTTFETEKREAKIMTKFFFPQKIHFYINFFSQRKTNHANLFAQTTHLASKPRN